MVAMATSHTIPCIDTNALKALNPAFPALLQNEI